MAKAAITRKYTLNAKGILDITENTMYIEDGDTGEMVNLKELLADFADREVKISVVYDEDYFGSEEQEEA